MIDSSCAPRSLAWQDSTCFSLFNINSLAVGVPVNETVFITPKDAGKPVVCGPSMGLPDGLNLSSACVLFGTPTAPGQSVNVYLDVSNYVVRRWRCRHAMPLFQKHTF